MLRFISMLVVYFLTCTISNAQINCGPPTIVAKNLGDPAYVTQDKITILSIRNIIIKLYNIEPPVFDTAMILFKEQTLSIGIGNENLVCEAISASGLDAIDIARFIIPIKS
jgi:hypothetical protein